MAFHRSGNAPPRLTKQSEKAFHLTLEGRDAANKDYPTTPISRGQILLLGCECSFEGFA